MPGLTGAEFHLTLRPLKKIKHLRVQIAAKSSKIDAGPQPDVTKILVKDRLRERPPYPTPPSPSHHPEN
jgi:hypothetical protein